MQNIKNSQNFLIDSQLVEKIVKKTNISQVDTVLEIGPGKGIITKVLSKYAEKVIAIEYDKDLYNKLLSQHYCDNVCFVYGDFLNYDLPKEGEYKVFSNIPFQITANIIKRLTETNNPPVDIYLIVQKEAAKKYCGIPYQKYEGLRAAIVKAQYEVEILYSFRKTDFEPVPNVDIVLLHFSLKKEKMNSREYAGYKDLVSYVYSIGKGESVRDRLSVLFSSKQVKRLCRDNGISEVGLYTYITSEQWCKIYCYSQIGLTDEKKQLLKNSYYRFERNNKGLKKQNRTSYRRAVKHRNSNKNKKPNE